MNVFSSLLDEQCMKMPQPWDFAGSITQNLSCGLLLEVCSFFHVLGSYSVPLAAICSLGVCSMHQTLCTCRMRPYKTSPTLSQICVCVAVDCVQMLDSAALLLKRVRLYELLDVSLSNSQLPTLSSGYGCLGRRCISTWEIIS